MGRLIGRVKPNPLEISDDRLIAGSSQITDKLKEVDTARLGGSVNTLVHVAKKVDNGQSPQAM